MSNFPYWTAFMMSSLMFSYPISAKNTQMTFEKILNVWNADGSREVDTKNCNAYTSQQNGVTVLTVNKECHFLHFSMFAFYNECKQNPGRQIQIVGEGVEVDFEANKANCHKVNNEVFDQNAQRVASNDSVKRKAAQNRYVIQFYSGKTSPVVNQIQCKTDKVTINKLEETYYLLSPNFTRKQASAELSRLKEKCASSGWVRLHPML